MSLLRRNKRQKNERPTAAVCQKDGVQNAAQTLLANIRFSSVDDPVRVIAVTSSIPNEGKTTIALSLAISIARGGAKCLIVEGDMRRRSMKTLLGARPRYGIHRLLTGKCTFEEAIVSTDFENVFFLDAEQGIPNPDVILSSPSFKKMLDSLRQHYHYIIVDTPPVSAFADASIVASKVDGTLLVARESYTNKAEIIRASEQLRTADANVLGIVLNGHRSHSGGYGGYGYYYDYYYDYYSEDDGKPQPSAGDSALSKLRSKLGSGSEDVPYEVDVEKSTSQTVQPVSALRASVEKTTGAHRSTRKSGGNGAPHANHASRNNSERTVSQADYQTTSKEVSTHTQPAAHNDNTITGAAQRLAEQINQRASKSQVESQVEVQMEAQAEHRYTGYKVPIMNQEAADRVNEQAARREAAHSSLDYEAPGNDQV